MSTVKIAAFNLRCVWLARVEGIRRILKMQDAITDGEEDRLHFRIGRYCESG